MKYTLGVDIGGTNTDGVLVDENAKILAWHKVPTTPEVTVGFLSLLQSLITKAQVPKGAISRIQIGTTYATNAILQASDLYKVGILRLSGVSGAVVPVGYGWPDELKNNAVVGMEHVAGGMYCDGREFERLNSQSILSAVNRLREKGMESLVIIGLYSPINNQQEAEVAELINCAFGSSFPITLSSDLGGVGFIERENSSILNAALKKCIAKGFAEISKVVSRLGIAPNIYFTQNNGTLVSIDDALLYPVLTISAGPTNSCIGAVKLASIDNGIVADVGGTSTDFAIVIDGFARQSLRSSEIAGIPLNFQMPDVLSIALGGGSVVNHQGGGDRIGPSSLGYEIKMKAMGFGGDILTLTDVALKLGFCFIEGAVISKINCDVERAQMIFDAALLKLKDLKAKMAGARGDLPLVLVGGGAELFRGVAEAQGFIIPPYSQVSNAYGAALAEISGTVDTVVSLEKREEVLNNVYKEAVAKAIKQGARLETVRIISQEILPFQYTQNNLARVRIVVAGSR